MERKASTLFNAIANIPVFKEYIDLRDIEINNSTDLVKVAFTFRNPVYETFRIIYMCDNKIVGYESVTSRMPNLCNIFNSKSYPMNQADLNRGCVLMVNRMFRLGANGYYLMHNHPSGNAKASKPDIEITKKIAQAVSGFKGHVIIDHGTYSWLDYERGKIKVSDNLPIHNTTQLKTSTECTSNPLLNQTISCRNDLARLMYDVKHSDNYSLLICCGSDNKIRLVQDIPNCFMNMSLDQLAGYIRNQARNSGSIKAFISTNNIKVFTKACELKHSGALTDTIAYNMVNDVIRLLAKDDTDITQDIFEKKRKQIKASEKENIYIDKDEVEQKKQLIKAIEMKSKIIKKFDQELQKETEKKQSQDNNELSDETPNDFLEAFNQSLKECSKKPQIRLGEFVLEPATNEEAREFEEEDRKHTLQKSLETELINNSGTSFEEQSLTQSILECANGALKKLQEEYKYFPKVEISDLCLKPINNTNDDTYEDEEE